MEEVTRQKVLIMPILYDPISIHIELTGLYIFHLLTDAHLLVEDMRKVH